MIVRLWQEIGQYLRLLNEHLSASWKLRTKVVMGATISIALTQAIWHNIILQYYYIIYLDA